MSSFSKKWHLKSQSCEGLIVITLFIITALLYYHDTFNYWFIIDDAAAILRSADPLKEILFANIYSYAFYTPLVALSFKPDVSFFGLNPVPYHVHNTLTLVFIAFMIYQILRLYTDRISSSVAAVVVLFSTPSLVCLLWIVLRQYLCAMLFSLISIYLFLKYKPDLKNNKFIVMIILILSELSFMGKEQYMTLPLVLFILSDGGLKDRIYKTYPYFILLTGHFLLRMYVLGGLGGYLGGNYLNYSPVVYIKTVFESIFAESKVLFGYEWFVILIVLPFLLRPQKIVLSALLWTASLLISFFAMSAYPYADTYRYWFISTVMISVMTGFAVNAVKRKIIKTIFFSAILLAFFVNTLNINKDVKIIFHEKSTVAKSVSKALVDSKYLNAVIIFPDDIFLVASQYIEYMVAIYHSLYKIKSHTTFLPFEFIVFYPEIIEDYERVYEIKSNSIIDITDSIDAKIKVFKDILLDERPAVGLIKSKNKAELVLKCESGKAIIAYSISWKYGRLFYGETIGPYLEKIDLVPFFRTKDIDIIPVENIKYHDKTWHIDKRSLQDGETLVTISCFTQENKVTTLSDMIYIRKQKDNQR
ncbi:MAG: hypothetical protein A2Y66_01450 [Nitrospirae bacterium RBG_13_41_22]|nr:MAG: hypothetical protein A2Y66_01450 [Nitrospirae bacterium RBG_13_41_22]